jgi:hypothetical protein
MKRAINRNLATFEETRDRIPEEIEDLREEKRPDFRGREKKTSETARAIKIKEENITVILKASSSVD